MIATRNSSTRNLIETIANELEQADKVLIGAGAGLSAADGFEYGGAWFQEHFGDFAAAYGMTDAYTAGFLPLPGRNRKMGVLEPLHQLQPLPQKTRVGIPESIGPGARQRLLCAHHQRRPLFPPRPLQHAATVLHPG